MTTAAYHLASVSNKVPLVAGIRPATRVQTGEEEWEDITEKKNPQDESMLPEQLVEAYGQGMHIRGRGTEKLYRNVYSALLRNSQNSQAESVRYSHDLALSTVRSVFCTKRAGENVVGGYPSAVYRRCGDDTRKTEYLGRC